MIRISIKRLKELGFEAEYRTKYWKGFVFLSFDPGDGLKEVYVCAQITSDESYARPAKGVKTEKDLLELCRLINGDLED